jgi:hypothetical protein
MIYIAPALVLAPYSINANSPRVGYHSIVTAANVAADEEADGYPVANLANPATYPRAAWRGTTTDLQYVTVVQAATGVDYVGIARHNLGSTGASVQLEGSDDGMSWDPVSIEVSPGRDDVLMLVFEPAAYAQWRLAIQPGSAAPEIAVLYLGTLLTLQRNIYVGHTPLVYGRNKSVVTGKSESGQFMGRTTRREFLTSDVSLKNLTPSWFRTYLDPFLDECQAGKPYFWAWRPGTYPLECGYAWIEGRPDISNQLPNGMMQAGWQMQGIR